MDVYCERYLAYQTFADAVSDQSVLERGSVTWAPGYGFPLGEKSMIIYCQGSGDQVGLAKTVETMLSQILEAQVTESLRADRYERSAAVSANSVRFLKTAAKAVARLEGGFEDAIAVRVLPEEFCKQLRTTNMQ
ncbi:hypothetical protein [Nitrosospira sp. NRS527]|uniref:hypothetical protein n=1 Tax=Nitrosospira sp. NRS527 TaxID=155925 RepID=UPI001AF34E45|nr:hypothetical protein [Nitrosospira sp. NRS527]BCT66756.1 hypothetical protein NNRS527_00324 [Nitrosospira sp. NRS527]